MGGNSVGSVTYGSSLYRPTNYPLSPLSTTPPKETNWQPSTIVLFRITTTITIVRIWPLQAGVPTLQHSINNACIYLAATMANVTTTIYTNTIRAIESGRKLNPIRLRTLKSPSSPLASGCCSPWELYVFVRWMEQEILLQRYVEL